MAMKKKLLLFSFLLTGILSFAQHPDLLNTDWKIVRFSNEFFPVLLPPPVPYEQVTHFSEAEPQMVLSFFNAVSAGLTFSGQDVFTVNNKSCTLAVYEGDNGEVNQFFGVLCNFFNQGDNFHYYIQDEGNQKTLVIGNGIFEEIHFVSSALGAKDPELSSLILAPNPVKSTLTVQNSASVKSVKIYDISGKLVYEIKNEGRKTLNIDMQSLKPGTYFVNFNNEKTHKIIKE